MPTARRVDTLVIVPKMSEKSTQRAKSSPASLKGADFDEVTFAEISKLIAASRERAFQTVNTVLIDLYWNIGEIIGRKISASEWGDGVVPQLAAYIARTQPGLRGFTRPNLFRMRQFYEAYKSESIVSALLRQLPWTHHLIILGQCKRSDEREFYLRTAIKEGWSSRQYTKMTGRLPFNQ